MLSSIKYSSLPKAFILLVLIIIYSEKLMFSVNCHDIQRNTHCNNNVNVMHSNVDRTVFDPLITVSDSDAGKSSKHHTLYVQ